MTYLDEIQVRRLLSDIAGVPPGEQGLNYIQQPFTGDGVTTVFNLSHLPSSLYPIFLYVSGILQTGTYSAAGTVVTFLLAPAGGAQIVVIYCY